MAEYKGIKYSEFKCGTTTAAQKLEFSVNETNATVKLEGYNSNQSETFKAIAEGAAAGAVKGAKSGL